MTKPAPPFEKGPAEWPAQRPTERPEQPTAEHLLQPPAFAQNFLATSGLPGRWRGRERFVVLADDFGVGEAFLAAWAAWRADPARCERLVFLALIAQPLSRQAIEPLLATQDVSAAAGRLELGRLLLKNWPLQTPDQHLRSFDGGRVQLHLIHGAIHGARVDSLRELEAEVDAFWLSGDRSGADGRDPWPDLCRRLARLAAPGAMLVAAPGGDAERLQQALTQVGFLHEAPGVSAAAQGWTQAQFAPVFAPEKPGFTARLASTQAEASERRPTGTVEREALVIGGGLAGCAAAWALARQGWRSMVLDRHVEPAQEASGNPAGLMHGIFNAPDSVHSRWFRAAALHTHAWATEALAQGKIHGQLDGFLRIEERLEAAQARAQLARAGLGAEWLTWCENAKSPFATGAWLFPTGGWLSPVDCCRAWLDEARQLAQAEWRGGSAVARIARIDGDRGPRWQALSAEGEVLGEAPVLVLACSLGAAALLADVACSGGTPVLRAVRGQITRVPASLSGLQVPVRPLAGQGYALGLPDGSLLCGATSQADDLDASVRAADHQHNLARAAVLGVLPPAGGDDAALLSQVSGRVGWRATTTDRLPVVGSPVDLQAEASARGERRRLDALRHRPRLHGLHALDDGSIQRHGLYVLTGLGSRGLTSAALAAELLASWVTGAPCPVPSSLRDALDVAR